LLSAGLMKSPNVQPISSADELSEVARRLLAPAARVPLDQLAEHWIAATVEATVPGHGALAHDLIVMNRIRGAFGRILMAGASAAAIAGKPCPWTPPCALDLLFREQARIAGRHGIPKPWALALDRRGFDLIVRITLFGFAIDWAGVVAHALATALRDHIDWKERAPGLFLPKPEVERLDIKEVSGALVPRLRSSVMMEFVTPLDAAGDDPLDRPASVIGRLARRIDLTARWMDIEIAADWRELSAVWNALDYDAASLSRAQLDSRSGRDQKRRFQRGLVQGALAVAGDLAPIWPVLALGRLTHAGRGATAGLGRYVLH
jgi:hypothetical protein